MRLYQQLLMAVEKLLTETDTALIIVVYVDGGLEAAEIRRRYLFSGKVSPFHRINSPVSEGVAHVPLRRLITHAAVDIMDRTHKVQCADSVECIGQSQNTVHNV
jgi:hypothetical protein